MPVDLAGLSTKEQFLGALAERLNFPAYFGHNWDALVDCLRDLDEWLGPASTYVVEVWTHEAFSAAHPDLWNEFLDIARSVASHRLHHNLGPLVVETR